jgi:hypothetical protein
VPFSDDVAYVLKQAIPDALDPIVRRAVGNAVPRLGEGGRFRIASTGTFSNRVAADLLAFGRNQQLDGAIIFVDVDVLRSLYFRKGRVVGGESDVIFERLGQVLRRGGLLDADTARAFTAREEDAGVAAVVADLPREAVRWGLERRVWEIAAALFLMRGGHFLIVEGPPDLGAIDLIDLSPTDLALEGLRRYDEWRHGAAGVPIPQRRAPGARPPEAPKDAPPRGPTAADEFLDELRKPE